MKIFTQETRRLKRIVALLGQFSVQNNHSVFCENVLFSNTSAVNVSRQEAPVHRVRAARVRRRLGCEVQRSRDHRLFAGR